METQKGNKKKKHQQVVFKRKTTFIVEEEEEFEIMNLKDMEELKLFRQYEAVRKQISFFNGG
jgi:hypothetical protein